MGLGYGGQILLSEIIATLVKNNLPADCKLADLDEHRLKGIAAPEYIFQLCHLHGRLDSVNQNGKQV
jgi:class 3 adenylate cyclase